MALKVEFLCFNFVWFVYVFSIHLYSKGLFILLVTLSLVVIKRGKAHSNDKVLQRVNNECNGISELNVRDILIYKHPPSKFIINYWYKQRKNWLKALNEEKKKYKDYNYPIDFRQLWLLFLIVNQKYYLSCE